MLYLPWNIFFFLVKSKHYHLFMCVCVCALIHVGRSKTKIWICLWIYTSHSFIVFIAIHLLWMLACFYFAFQILFLFDLYILSSQTYAWSSWVNIMYWFLWLSRGQCWCFHCQRCCLRESILHQGSNPETPVLRKRALLTKVKLPYLTKYRCSMPLV